MMGMATIGRFRIEIWLHIKAEVGRHVEIRGDSENLSRLAEAYSLPAPTLEITSRI